MKLLVFGANGQAGANIVAQALALGHEVTAFVRSSMPEGVQHAKLHVLKGDVLDPESVRKGVEGHEAVLAALGPRGTKPTTLLSQSAKHIVAAMEAQSIRKLVWHSALGVGDSADKVGFLFGKIVLPLFLKEPYADHARAEEVVRASHLDWILVRPARMTNAPATGSYRVDANLCVSIFNSVARADVAAFMLKQLETEKNVRQTLGIVS